MSFDAFMWIPNVKEVKGETQDDEYAKKDAFEILSFEIGAENNINIGSISGGGGAGKATFKEFNITKKTDTASAGLFLKLCEGKHFDDAHVVLRRSGGSDNTSGAVFLQFDFKLLMVQDISWSGSDGDDICEEQIIFQYGAMKVTYSTQDKQGKMKEHSKAMWSRVKNKADLVV
ncbi:MAG: Hcp1 family type VI secretion system effector [Rhodobacteraceae bacterium]|nr:Hcp1 family type VI secretion system effector [Paracoccaceae bacterium]